MLYVCAVHMRCTHVYSSDSSLIDKRKELPVSEQRYATVSASVHLPVRTAAYDAVGSCIFLSAAYI
jgi:hypothetical protein